jgi:hypothetical protein
LAAILWLLASTLTLDAQALQSIRNDVQNGPPPSPSQASSNSSPQSTSNQSSNTDPDTAAAESNAEFGLILGGALVGAAAALSPIWVPMIITDDHPFQRAELHQFPYDDTTNPPQTFPFAIRVDADYVEAFDNLDRINGHLLISTASRFEFDARFQHLAERLADGSQDQLWNGDCNITYRFAQCDFCQFRMGLGMNWLYDPSETNLGFNFTYGADIYPMKPWVFSTVLDAGTLGHAGLFRARTTAGVVYRSVELYTGYEYTDIGSVHWNGLIGGVRLWF